MNPFNFPKISLMKSDHKDLLKNLDKAVFRFIKMNRLKGGSSARVIDPRGDQ